MTAYVEILLLNFYRFLFIVGHHTEVHCLLFAATYNVTDKYAASTIHIHVQMPCILDSCIRKYLLCPPFGPSVGEIWNQCDRSWKQTFLSNILVKICSVAKF